MIDDEVIDTFISALDALEKDEWRAQTLAFETLVESLPKPGSTSKSVSGIMPWYKSYTALRRLSKPISSVLLNPRSTVVKHCTQHFVFLVQRIRDLNPPKADMCKYLLKDLLTPILSMHAQTVKVIRNYAIDMMTILIPLCRFKSGLPVLLEKLRKDKSSEVREGCVKYLNMIVKYWSREGDESPEETPYLTDNICNHIGNGLARAMMDPTQSVRSEARSAFEHFRCHYPELWNAIVQKPDGIFSKDNRLKKSIMNVAMKADAEGRSVGENPSYESGDDYDVRTLGSVGSRGSMNSWNSTNSFISKGSSKLGFRASVRSSSNTRPRAGTKSAPKRTTSSGPRPPKKSPFGNAASPVPKSPNRARPNAIAKPLAAHNGSTAGNTPSENYMVANQLLASHKIYIDDLMESLRGEMNTVRDFETLLVKSQNNPNEIGTYGPSEDDVLKYYEAVYAYLDKGGEDSIKLRKEMERIGRT
jgi:hypothetical protein